MIGKVALFLALVGGIVFCALKLVELLFPKSGVSARVVEKLGKGTIGGISGTLEKGREMASQAEEIIDGLQNFLSGSLPKPLRYRGRDSGELIEKARGILGHVKDFMDNPQSLTSEPVLRFLLSTISTEGQPLFRDFRKGNLYVITDDPDHPFQITPVISQTANKIVSGTNSSEGKARAIFSWMVNSVDYGGGKRGGKGYRTSSEVFSDREGVCGEMGILYVVMARSVGLISNYVEVSRDDKGENVTHACASVRLNGRDVLVDPAYHIFDVRHMRYRILPDKEAVHHFKAIRR
jgi:hypothetical protein